VRLRAYSASQLKRHNLPTPRSFNALALMNRFILRVRVVASAIREIACNRSIKAFLRARSGGNLANARLFEV